MSKAGDEPVASASWLSNLSRLIDARLQALSSRCMYSEHGLEAVIGPVFGQVCQSLIVVSYCMPGSAHSHAACAMSRIRLRALWVCAVSPVWMYRVRHSPSSRAERMNSSLTRTELFAFWYWMLIQASPSSDTS